MKWHSYVCVSPRRRQVISVAGHSVRAMRLSFVGEMGWELHVPAQSCDAVYRALTDAGRQFGLVDAGYRAIDSLSAEKGQCGILSVILEFS